MKPQHALIGAMPRLERTACCAMLLAFATSGFASDTASQSADLNPRYAAIAPIQLVPQEGLQRLTLHLSVLQASRSNTSNTAWADVRVLDATGRTVAAGLVPSAYENGIVVRAPFSLPTGQYYVCATRGTETTSYPLVIVR